MPSIFEGEKKPDDETMLKSMDFVLLLVV